jgi:thymidylate synthase
MNLNVEEYSYLNLLSRILEHGEERKDRTGVGTKALFGTSLRFSLENNTLPLLTTKKMFYKGIVEELLFFLRGETDTKKLETKGVNIWKGNTSREFLDKRGLTWLKEGDMGYGYGWQWRRFAGEKQTPYTKITDSLNKGTDQIANVFNSLKNDPHSRRHLVSAWNPNQEKETALVPCHYAFQFYVDNNNKLSCMWNQRSVDTFLGLPFNIASYATLTHIFAKALGYQPKEIIFIGGDTHIYLNHLDQVKEQISRTPFDFPQLKINKEISSVKDMENLQFEDFEVINYKSYPSIKAFMAI